MGDGSLGVGGNGIGLELGMGFGGWELGDGG